MKYTGQFISQAKNLVDVTIVTNRDTSSTIEIGTDGVYFTTDPVSIKGEINDTFDVMLTHSATINLQTEQYLPDLFCKSAMDAAVAIRVDGQLVFAGFIEPQAYSQPYNETTDELQLSCIDALSAMQYSYYEDIGHGGTYYREAKRNAGQRTFMELIFEALQIATEPLRTGEVKSVNIWYDGSKALDNADTTDPYYTFSQISINDILFLGETMDDVWTYQDIVKELLRYFNLHIIQVGLDFYIFDWNDLKDGKEVKFYRLWQILPAGQQATPDILTPTMVTIANAIAGGTDAEISVGETFNRLELTANVATSDKLIESPLDEDLLKNAFTSKQLYMEEISSAGEGETAIAAFEDMVFDRSTDWGEAKRVKWYAQVKKNSSWQFSGGGTKDIYNKYAKGNTNQQDLLNALRDKPGAALISFGSVVNEMASEDDSPVSSLDMETSLFISVNGNNDDSETGCYPQPSDILKAIPAAKYVGNTTGGVFSPTDSQTINYIVFSGKVILNPIMLRTDNMAALQKVFAGGSITREESDSDHTYKYSRDGYWHCTSEIQTNSQGNDIRYYAQELYKAETPTSTPEIDRSRKWPLCPFTDEYRQYYPFQFSAIGESADTISKIPVLACMLIIGDKCVVELGMDGTAQGKDEGKFVWQDYKTREECADDAEYYAQSFTLGFNPRKNDCLLGKSFDMQNTIDYTMGVETTGTAIPITKDDHISGRVQFLILGPVNLLWDVITRKHPTFWRHTSWSSSVVPIMAHVSSVILKEFNVGIYSNNGMEQSDEDNDYVYYSDTDETYYNKKDDLEFKITSALTTAEALDMGVTNQIAYSTPQDNRTNDAVLTIYDTRQDITAKAEQLYVDAYYQEYHQPKLQLKQKLSLNAVAPRDCWHTLFYHPAPDKTFYPIAVSYNLMQAYTELELKEL